MNKLTTLTIIMLFAASASAQMDPGSYWRGAEQAQQQNLQDLRNAQQYQYMLQQQQQQQILRQQREQMQQKLQRAQIEAADAEAQAERAKVLLVKADSARAQLKNLGYAVRLQLGADGYQRYIVDSDGGENWATSAYSILLPERKRLAIFKLVRLFRENEYIVNEKLVATNCDDNINYIYEFITNNEGKNQLSPGYMIAGDLLVIAKNACISAKPLKSNN
jgi:small-conductance mechanosensitive channel